MEKRVLGLGGSPRKGGNTDVLLKEILTGAAEEGAETHIVHLRDYDFKPCIGCEKCRKSGVCLGLRDGMTLLYEEVRRSRGMVLFSPSHNYNVTAWMKAFIDRLYCLYEFAKVRPGPWSSRLAGQGRKAVIGGVCEIESREGLGLTMDALRLPLDALGYEVVDAVEILGIFRKAGVREKPEALERAREAGRLLGRKIG